MKSIYDRDPIRIPVKLVDGEWEYFYGGNLPVNDGAVGDLVVDRSAIKDKKFLAKLRRGGKYKILDAGTPLMVALTVRSNPDIGDKLREHLIPNERLELDMITYHRIPRSADTRFVQITVAGPTDFQRRLDPKETGGVWLHVEGLIPKGVISSTIDLPSGVSDKPADSLNHAFTLLSERYEPWRKSHTGNIYDRMFYQEKNGRWYPLRVLREAAIAKEEHELIRTRWAEIAEAIGLQGCG